MTRIMSVMRIDCQWTIKSMLSLSYRSLRSSSEKSAQFVVQGFEEKRVLFATAKCFLGFNVWIPPQRRYLIYKIHSCASGLAKDLSKPTCSSQKTESN